MHAPTGIALSATAPTFFLEQDFLNAYIGRQPEWGPVGYVTYKRTYARGLKAKTLYPRHLELATAAGLVGSEEWWLTVTRVVEGTFTILANHCLSLHLPWDWARAQSKAQEMFRLMWDFKFLPPGRGLWMMGTPAIEKVGGAALNNCGFVSTEHIDTDFAEPFCMLMDYSMLGVGVGGDTRGAGKIVIQAPRRPEVGWEIGDTREEWITALRQVLNAYVGKGFIPLFDYSKIRPAGAPIETFGGTASGPGPLRDMIVSIINLLDARIGQAITSADIVDIFNLVGKCVVAGNTRRSAEIMFGEPTDEGFLELKDKEKHGAALDNHRWASNNSVFATVGQGYGKLAKQTAKNGEPGYFWLENAQKYGRMIDAPDFKDKLARGGNPCLEQTLWDGELCNLVETFPAHHANLKEYLRTVKFAYLYAKVVTLVPTHNPKTNAVTLKNRRIGCSMSGIVQAVRKFGRRKFLNMCDETYAYIQELDEQYSDWMCVPRSIKTTSVKPSGTVSLLPKSVTPGMHYPIAEYYWRVIRFATDSAMLPGLRAAGYMCIEIDPAKEPNTTAVYFPVRIEDFDRAEKDVSMWEQLELAADLQAHWADNQVSVTVKFDKKAEGPHIARALEIFETRLKGVSFLPHDDHGYDHAPYQPITKAEYEAAAAQIGSLDLTGALNETQEKFCDTDKCLVPTPKV